jgi:SNF2 family DNA or RNA helicase
MFIYEEFLSRSSTRNALTKGGNFLGMMNVLMQLRKVCNHPDLFEPRSVLTPFVTDPIELSVPECATSVSSTVTCVGEYLRCPVWCGSQGLSSIDAALRHDTIESDELMCFYVRQVDNDDPVPDSDIESLEASCPPAVIELLKSLDQLRRVERVHNVTFLTSLSSRRCRRPSFPYPSRVLNLLALRNDQVIANRCAIETPAALLDMVRSQQRRADDSDALIKNFVCCVPKADSKPAILGTSTSISRGSVVSGLDDVLLAPVQEALRPFRKAQARLSSFFPDRKLVQFDAGKLQTLAELLRELKRGGHRALIFTQMSKMLDILETFLNLNGHTYLRLDGSTSIDRRQRLMDRFNSDPKVFCFILSTRSGGLGINLTGADSVIFYDQDWNPAMYVCFDMCY